MSIDRIQKTQKSILDLEQYYSDQYLLLASRLSYKFNMYSLANDFDVAVNSEAFTENCWHCSPTKRPNNNEDIPAEFSAEFCEFSEFQAFGLFAENGDG